MANVVFLKENCCLLGIVMYLYNTVLGYAIFLVIAGGQFIVRRLYRGTLVEIANESTDEPQYIGT